MMMEGIVREIDEGVSAANQGNTLVALVHLEKAAREGRSPRITSYLGYCLARERKQVAQGLALCRQAIQKEPASTEHYLNLGRVYLIAGQKGQAIKAMRRGLKNGRNSHLIKELQRLGRRRPPLFQGLTRNHPANKYAGLLLHRLGWR